MKKPLQYSVYKGMGGKFGAVQFNFQKPHYYRDREKDFEGRVALDNTGKLKDDWKQREGAIFLEATSANGKNSYDWEQKITLALSVTDMSKLALGLTNGQKIEIMHDPGAKTVNQGAVVKHLTLESPKGIQVAGAILTVSQKNGDDVRRHTIPLSPDECLAIRTLLLAAIPKALAWE